MDYFERQGFSALGGLQQPNSMALQSGTAEPQNIAKNEAVVPESCNILTSSMLMVNGIDLATTSTADMGIDSSWPMTCSSSSLAEELHKQPPLSSISSLTTPPPEASGFPPAYPYPWAPMQSYSYPTPHSSQTAYSAPLSMAEPGSLSTISVAECYLRGSSLEDSPLSSPGSCNDGSSYQDQQLMGEHFRQTSCPSTSSTVLGVNRSQSPLVGHVYGAMTQSVDMMATIPSFEYMMNHTPMNETLAQVGERNLGSAQKTVKMPQRKGGIQLWQFMYSLLTDPEKKYSNIIEWTSNMKDREFRMLEPEAIAVWWGHHKNKPNMSYDKFSRSLRYYYDKGILKKIPGERYVYRFLIDPEHMYRHIGISECRPKLKPMPQAAKLAMTKHQVEQSTSQGSPIVTPAPEPLMGSGTDNGSPSPKESSAANSSIDITTCSSALYSNPPPPYSHSPSSNVNVLQVGGPIYSSASTGNLTDVGKGYDEVSVPPIKRSRSLDCPNSGTNANSRFNHYSPSGVIPYGQMSQSCDDFSPLPHISAESSFLDNPMLLSAHQGGPGPTVSELNYVACGSDIRAQSVAVTSASLCTQQAGLPLNCKPFPLQLNNHNFTAQWH